MTLTGFLLARCAEDYERARALVEPPIVVADGEREQRHATARRLLVELHQPHRPNRQRPDVPPSCGECSSTVLLDPTTLDAPCLTLALLATAYEDHPDYREEWRP